MDCQTTTRTFNLNKEKNIGKVIYIVEGEDTEIQIIKTIFHKILGYEIIQKKRNGNIYELKNNKKKNSIVTIINSKNSNIKSIMSQEYIEETLKMIQEQYKIDYRQAPIFYIFDRDRESNDNIEVIKNLIETCKNSREESEIDKPKGLLLLSYPCIESFLIEANEKETKNFLETNKEKLEELSNKYNKLKPYINQRRYKITKLNEAKIMNAFEELIETLQTLDIEFENINVDDMAITNKKIFELEEKEFEAKGIYRLLSLLLISLVDLGIIEYN